MRLLFVLAVLSTPAWTGAPGRAAAPAAAGPSPLIFVENAGQFTAGARFQVIGGGHTLWLAEDAIWLTLFERGAHPSPAAGLCRRGQCLRQRDDAPSIAASNGVHIKLSFPGANPHPRLEPFQRLETHVSYLIGDDPAKWRADVPAWGGVRYVDLYPGLDLELSGEQGRLQLWLSVRPGADLHAVRLRVEGAEAVAVDGDLLRLATAVGESAIPLLRARGPAPAAAVRAGGASAFDIAAPFAPQDSSPAGAPAPADDPSDLLYSTFFGGSSGDWGEAIVVDDSGAAYIAGATRSPDLPVAPGAFDATLDGDHDAHVLKLNAAGSAPEYVTYLGGSDGDSAHGLAVDGSGAAYVTGHTDCYGFPATAGAYDTTCTAYDWGGDAFVVKLNPDGSDLEYATFLGGSIQEGGFGIALDAGGAAYVLGVTGSSDFATTPNAFDRIYNGGTDAFVAKLSADGSVLEYATFLGGRGDEWSSGIALDGSGAAYVTGETLSANFPITPGAFSPTYSGGQYQGDAFIAKLNAAGSDLDYATFLGGSRDDGGSGIALDGNGAAYVTGLTYSPDLPTTPGALDPTYDGTEFYGDAFIAKLNAAGSGLEYATFLGGSLGESGNGIALDGSGAAYVTGETGSGDLTTTPGALDTSLGGGLDIFVVRLNAAGSRLDYATYLGGSGDDFGPHIAVTGSGTAWVTGETGSSDWPTTPDAFDASFNGSPNDAFLARLAMEPKLFYSWLPLVFRNE